MGDIGLVVVKARGQVHGAAGEIEVIAADDIDAAGLGVDGIGEEAAAGNPRITL